MNTQPTPHIAIDDRVLEQIKKPLPVSTISARLNVSTFDVKDSINRLMKDKKARTHRNRCNGAAVYIAR